MGSGTEVDARDDDLIPLLLASDADASWRLRVDDDKSCNWELTGAGS
jgi:hypothetical protein